MLESQNYLKKIILISFVITFVVIVALYLVFMSNKDTNTAKNLRNTTPSQQEIKKNTDKEENSNICDLNEENCANTNNEKESLDNPENKPANNENNQEIINNDINLEENNINNDENLDNQNLDNNDNTNINNQTSTNRRYLGKSVAECDKVVYDCEPMVEVPFNDDTGCGCEIVNTDNE